MQTAALPAAVSAAAPTAGRRRLPPAVRTQQILDAALEEFAERGYMATRMEDIASRAGLSKGGVYTHFKAKEQVFEALLRRSLVLPDLQPLPDGRPMDGAELAAWLVERIYASLGRRDTLMTVRLLIAESERVPHLVALWHSQVLQPHAQLLGRVLAERAPLRRDGRPSIIVREPWLVMAPAVHAMVTQLVLGAGADVDLEQARAAHVALLTELLELPTSV